jgi:hypothetical protein
MFELPLKTMASTKSKCLERSRAFLELRNFSLNSELLCYICLKAVAIVIRY